MSNFKDYVEIKFDHNPNYIMIDKYIVYIELFKTHIKNPPERIEDIQSIIWDESYIYNPNNKGTINFNNDLISFDEEKYNDWVQPYVDIWQAKKDQQQQEQEEAEAEYNRFENRQARALTQLNEDFATAAERAHVKSSLGFTVDANSTANENINGLLITIGDGTVQFCDYYNQFHELNKSQLETLQSEIIQNGQSLYAQKWQYRTVIENCTDNDQLDAAIAAIKFTYMDFTPQTESTETDGTTE